MDEPSTTDASARFADVKDGTVTPEELEGIQTTLHRHGEFFDPATTSILVLGHYGEDEEPHLRTAQAALAGDGTDPNLLKDVFDFTTLWTAKFKLLVDYADHVVCVYEHSQGGHCWEAGYIDQRRYRERTHVFYRPYLDDEDAHREAYNGMFWKYIVSMRNVDRAHGWETSDELVAALRAVDELPTDG